MIKFGIHPKVWEGERCKFGKVLGKCQNFLSKVFCIFWDILEKVKGNLGQECVKRGPFILAGHNWNNWP